MELDIHSEWVSFNFYSAPGAGDPSKVAARNDPEAARYLEADDRDFFLAYGRSEG
jgi:hypothetical protein